MAVTPWISSRACFGRTLVYPASSYPWSFPSILSDGWALTFCSSMLHSIRINRANAHWRSTAGKPSLQALQRAIKEDETPSLPLEALEKVHGWSWQTGNLLSLDNNFCPALYLALWDAEEYAVGADDSLSTKGGRQYRVEKEAPCWGPSIFNWAQSMLCLALLFPTTACQVHQAILMGFSHGRRIIR